MVVDTEIIWSGDFDPAITSETQTTRETTAPPLTLALAGAAWLAFSMAKRSGQRDVETTFGTMSWQAFALVRIGLQGGAKRPPTVTQAIYARAVEADEEIRVRLGAKQPRSRISCGALQPCVGPAPMRSISLRPPVQTCSPSSEGTGGTGLLTRPAPPLDCVQRRCGGDQCPPRRQRTHKRGLRHPSETE